MNSIIDIGRNIMSIGKGPAAGIAVGSAFATMFFCSVTSAGKDVYVKALFSDCENKTLRKVAGVALMAFGLLGSLVSSVAFGFFVSLTVGVGGSTLGPAGTMAGIALGVVSGIISITAVGKVFANTIKDLNKVVQENRDFYPSLPISEESE